MRTLLLLALLCLPARALPPGLIAVHPVSRGIIGWWTFRQVTGSTTGIDTSGYGRNLASSYLGGGQPPFYYAYFTNGNQTFNCVNFQRSIYTASSFTGLPTGAAPCSQAFWVNAQQNGSYPAFVLFFCGAFINDSQINGIRIDNGVTGHVKLTTPPYDPVGFQVGLPTGTWYHLAFVCDGTYSRCYINGLYYNTVVAVQAIQSPITTFTFGNASGGFAYWGMLSDYRIYNRTLSDAEVFQLATQYQ